jgi:C4-dicarboxylate transporter
MCWEGYVSPPLNISELSGGLFYTILSFLPIILIICKWDTKTWQKFMIGGTEFVVIAYSVYEGIEIFSHGH